MLGVPALLVKMVLPLVGTIPRNRLRVAGLYWVLFLLGTPRDILVKDLMDMEMEQLEQMENNDEQINGK